MSKNLLKERELWKDGVQCYCQQVTSRASRERATASSLYVSCDGAGLADTCEVPAVSRWVTSGSGLVSGKSFVDAIHVRCGCLYTKVRASRGWTAQSGHTGVACDVCPSKRATNKHMLQQCPKTAHARVERHNSVQKLLIQKLTAKGFQVEVEPAIKTDNGVRRPDVVAFKPGKSATLIDITIIADIPGELSAAHDRKVRKYDDPQMRTWIAEHAGVRTASVAFTSLTFNWRGSLCVKRGTVRQKRAGSKGARYYDVDTGDQSLGGSSGKRRRLRVRPPAPVGPAPTGRQGRPVQVIKTGRGRHCRPEPAGTGGAVPICQ